MIRFFDYLFYRVSDLYINKWKDSQGMMAGVGVVSIMQLIHLLFILLILALFSENINEVLFEKREGLNFMHSGIILPCLIVFAFNLYRYFKILPFEKTRKIWGNEKIKIKLERGKWVVIYIILNFGLTLFLSIYRKYYFN